MLAIRPIAEVGKGVVPVIKDHSHTCNLQQLSSSRLGCSRSGPEIHTKELKPLRRVSLRDREQNCRCPIESGGVTWIKEWHMILASARRDIDLSNTLQVPDDGVNSHDRAPWLLVKQFRMVGTLMHLRSESAQGVRKCAECIVIINFGDMIVRNSLGDSRSDANAHDRLFANASGGGAIIDQFLFRTEISRVYRKGRLLKNGFARLGSGSNMSMVIILTRILEIAPKW